MFAETGEDPTRLSIALDAEADATLGFPTDDPLREGQIISEEIDATVQGYRAQVNHSILVGGTKTLGYDYYRTAMETAIKLFHECVTFIVPGKTTCGQLVDYYAKLAEKFGAEDRSGVVLHSSGIANLSRPRLGPANSRGLGHYHRSGNDLRLQARDPHETKRAFGYRKGEPNCSDRRTSLGQCQRRRSPRQPRSETSDHRELTCSRVRKNCSVTELLEHFISELCRGSADVDDFVFEMVSYTVIFGDGHHVLSGIHALRPHPFGVASRRRIACSSPWHKILDLPYSKTS